MENRTQEQFEEIAESTIRGKWTQAGKQYIEYGFDLPCFDEYNQEMQLMEEINIAYLIDAVMGIRLTNQPKGN